MVTDLVDANHVQQNLFDSEDRNRSKRLKQAMDRVNSTMGAETLPLPSQELIENGRSWRIINRKAIQHHGMNW